MTQETDLEQMLDALAAEGRVRRMAQHDSADLPAWCLRHQRRADLRRYAAAACLTFLLLFPFSSRAGNSVSRHPTNGQYSLADTLQSIEQTMLCQ
ncbi:MAG: hypothetical protein IJ524_06615 [Bacteroidales bacterium]|nr:hypothetical protein [Bacteroidales bacterium]